MKKIGLLNIISLFVMICKQTNEANAQTNNGTFNDRFKKLEDDNLNKTYEGIVTSKGIKKGLFPIQSTGVTMEPIKKAGETFLKSLIKEQLAKTQFEIQNNEWQKWSNVDNGLYKRQGVSIKEMSKEQRKFVFQLMQEALSAKGL